MAAIMFGIECKHANYVTDLDLFFFFFQLTVTNLIDAINKLVS